MFTALYRRFNNFRVNALYDLLETSPLEYSSEWITDLLVTDENITMDYYRTIRSIELFYDNSSEEETPEVLSKAYKASCMFSKSGNYAVIYGSKAACSNLERYLEKEAHISFYSYRVELKGILNKISSKQYQIKKIEYYNVEFFNVVLSALTLEFKTNLDAQQTLKKIPTSPSKTSIEIYYNGGWYTLNFDLINNSVKLIYDSLKSTNIDNVRELIFSFFEGE
ncbi:hypothetical protein ABFY57_25205 [Paenibacillus polymyxa]|uniref:hypothetical protein n=1 Tax=Paenibacillus TaxID=44249 RepID=UPI00142DCAF1|nr:MULTISPECIES: hypothetical protein [unclassified Paenibacillus]KAF6614976.1 hypothetical protein HFE00_21790 [Paenibacillus sp. EKM101P]KAF6622303.1 hypothetical protein HFE03_14460 [Paenibacillus sp. EKM102P]KAF6631147.1 hypothetical protein HFE01_12495 [Paenibacillus sp. EKM10P]KAF6650326.1 hypothetical protein HFE02_06480 [Paenibacillus sp. EKM11P]